MNAGRSKKVEELYQAALAQAPEQRVEFVARACPDDANIRREVELLLAQAPELQSTVSVDLGEGAGTLVGRYRLLQRIGEGGMGEVWLAEQKEPVRRRVALKLIKAGMNTRQVIARFESERQALALMDHSAIATVFDADSTPDGAPYFVMEYVAGVPITTYCDNHRLSMRERLELFIDVCEGVQHAHQKAIIHRDLKPSNILVTEIDGRAAPKIIDFGVAKALGQKLAADTIFTRVGALIGTPEYMSPEQANSPGEDIDTRTDVYSLGIILYELLAGAPPLDLRKIAFEEFLRRLREEEPPKPSTKIRTQDPATSSEVARKRQTEPAALARQMRGDLDSIALKTLEKDRARRYGSAADLAADIGRYLRNEAVLAVPPSAAYRARKFARRHRTGLAMAAAFVLVLIAAAGISIWQSIRASREAAVAQAINDFLRNDLLAQASASRQASPSTEPDPHLEVRTALDRAAARIGGKFAAQPEVEAAIRVTMGQTYEDLGLYAEARKQLERALELHRRALGANSPKTLKTMTGLGWIAGRQGKYHEAEALLSQNLAIQRRVMGPEHPDVLGSMNDLAIVYHYERKYAQAEVLLSQAVATQRRVLGPEHPGTLAFMNNLGIVYYAEGKNAEAEALYGQILEIERRVLGAEHPNTLMSVNNLARVYQHQGKYAQAEMLFSRNLDVRRRVLGPEHPHTLKSMNGLAEVSYSEGKYTQAEALFSQTLEIQRRVLGPEHPDTLRSMRGLANVYSSQGKYRQAEALFSQLLEIERRVHSGKLNTFSHLAFMYHREGNYTLAENYAAQALAGRWDALGPQDSNTMASAADLALACISQGKFTEAEPLAREATEFYREKQPDDWQRFRAESLLGASLAGQKKYAEAEPLLVEGYQGMLARKKLIAVPDQYYLDRAHEWLVQFYLAWGKPDKAAEWRTSASPQVERVKTSGS